MSLTLSDFLSSDKSHERIKTLTKCLEVLKDEYPEAYEKINFDLKVHLNDKDSLP